MDGVEDLSSAYTHPYHQGGGGSSQRFYDQGFHPPPIQVQPTSLATRMPMSMLDDRQNQSDANGTFSSRQLASSVHPNLEYLAGLSDIFVKQKIELLEVISGCETNNKYEVMDLRGKVMFKVRENTEFCTRQCFGSLRPLELSVTDLEEEYELMHFSRPLSCQGCLFPSCLQSLSVYCPPGDLCGTIEEEWSFCIPRLLIKDESGQVAYHLEGPFCTIACCSDVNFRILSESGEEVGTISKKWSGFIKEAFTDFDNFGITFPADISLRMKAVMMGALFLIDFMFYEQSGNRRRYY